MPIGFRPFPIVRNELFDRYEKGSKLSGIIYIHRISDNRFGGVAGRNFNMFRKLCGYTALKNAVLVTNMWDEVSYSVGEARERELSGRFFRLVLDHGALMTRHNNTVQSAHNVIRRILRNDPMVLRIQRELVDERRDIVNTTAGDSINRQLHERIGRYRAELDELREAMNRALREKDEVARQGLEVERRRLQERMEEAVKDSEDMSFNYALEKSRIEAKVNEMEKREPETKPGRWTPNDPHYPPDVPNLPGPPRDLIRIPVY